MVGAMGVLPKGNGLVVSRGRGTVLRDAVHGSRKAGGRGRSSSARRNVFVNIVVAGIDVDDESSRHESRLLEQWMSDSPHLPCGLTKSWQSKTSTPNYLRLSSTVF